jgi:DNA processing protein
MDERHAIDAVALLLAAGVGSRSAKLLVERFGTATAAFAASRDELSDAGLARDQIDALLDPPLRDRAVRELEAARREGGEAVPLGSPGYPPALAETYDPPAVLFVRGAWREALLQSPVVAIVGSRRASTYGRNVAERLSADLASRGVTIVSGLARGIDAAAHRAAVEVGGRSVAVMGTGLDAIYPRENLRLAERLLERGALVTEFPTGTPPTGQNFPFRNRVISGLSLGVLVVEASERSGSLITARMAAEQGRDVWAVPGNITSGNSYGPNHLIKDGARPVLEWRDVVEELPARWRDEILEAEREHSGPSQRELAAAVELSAHEKRVLAHLAPDAPRHLDLLWARTELDSGALSEALFTLEIKGLVAAVPGGMYVRRL